MSWLKFHFNCRFLNQKLSENLSVEQAKEYLLTHYSQLDIGGGLPSRSLEGNLFNRIYQEKDLSKLESLLLIYGRLNLSWDLTALTKLKNIRNYLFFLITVFLLLSGIYNLLVLPVFIDIFEQNGSDIDSGLDSFYSIWLISVSVISLISIIVLGFYSFINQVGRKEIKSNAPLFSKMFVPEKIMNKLMIIDALTNAPLEARVNEFSAQQIKLYKSLKEDNLNVAQELQILLDDNKASLLNLINVHITKLLALLTITVVGGVGYLVYSFYQPIFSLGMII